MDKKTIIIIALAAALVMAFGVMGISLAYFAGKSSAIQQPTAVAEVNATSEAQTGSSASVEQLGAKMEMTDSKPASELPVEKVDEIVVEETSTEVVEEIGPYPYEKVSALVVGTNISGPSMSELKYAESDAERFAKVIEKTYGFMPTLLQGEKATKAGISNELKRQLDSLKPDEDFIFYFAGHGHTIEIGKDERYGVLLPYDAAGFDLDAQDQIDAALTIQSIVESLKSSKGRHLMAIFDSCYSGWVTKVEGGSDSLSLDGKLPYESMKLPSVHVMAAGKAEELAVENDDLKGGALTATVCEVLAEGRMRKFPSLFFNVKDRLESNEALIQGLSGAAATPQFRSFRQNGGAFSFIAPSSYKTWEIARSKSMLVDGETVTVSDDYLDEYFDEVPEKYSEDVTEDEVSEYLEIFAEADKSEEPVEVPEEKVDAWEARASMGDSEAMVLLTELLGRSSDERDRNRAFSHAFSAFDTKADSGKFALGRAYSNGYGVEKDESHGEKLIKESGFEEWLNLYKQIDDLNSDVQALKGDGTPEGKLNAAQNIANKAGPALKAAGGFMKNLANKIPFLKDPTTVVTKALEDSLIDVVAANPDYDSAIKRLEKAQERVTKAKKLDDEYKSLINEGIEEVLVALRAKDQDLSKELLSAFIASSSPTEEEPVP
ncbi:MAG: caspase family protein [Verrucomicrobiota bacterium]